MTSYAILALIATVFNLRDRRMLALTALVTAGIFVPVPAVNFYLICALGEALIGLLSFRIGAAASRPIWRISALLVVFHGLGYLLNGYPPASPYHIIVQICEHTELLACILLSDLITKRWRNA
jgi:hypothetical protein